MNTEYLTDIPYVTTVDNTPTVTTAPANIAASIITTPTDGASIGDIAITFSEKLINDLNDIAAEVEAIPCGQRKRTPSCAARVAEFAERTNAELQPGGRLAYVVDNPTVLVSAADISSIVSFITNARVRAIVSLAVMSYLISKVPAKLPSVFRLMKDMAITGGLGSEVQSCPPIELGCDGCKGNTFGICVFPWAGCPCKKTKRCPDPNPDCDSDGCQGDSDNFCTNKNKGCACEPSEEEGQCPEDAGEYPDCDECGGNAGDFKCKEVDIRSKRSFASQLTWIAGIQWRKRLPLQRAFSRRRKTIKGQGGLQARPELDEGFRPSPCSRRPRKPCMQ